MNKNLLEQACFLFCALTFFMMFTNCKKEVLPPPDAQGYIYLKNVNSLKLIKEAVEHNWKIHYGYGGFTGNSRFEMPDSYFKFLSGDRIQFINRGTQTQPISVTWEKRETIFSKDKQWQLVSSNGPSWIPESIRNDTLTLVQNAVDANGYSMTQL